MDLWLRFWFCANALRPAFSRRSTFVCFVIALAGMCVRTEHAGVTSIVRALNLAPSYYRNLLHLFNSSGWSVQRLTRVWVPWVFRVFGQYKVNGRFVLIADGIKAPKEGRKMPAVKSLHQESASNSKPEYIMGHSFQAVTLLFRHAQAVWAVPLACRIHEGLIFSNRDRRTLKDKLASLLTEIISALPRRSNFYLVADAYYACEKTIKHLLAQGNDLVSRVKSTAVAYAPSEDSRTGRRGRPKKYGEKIKLKDLFAQRSKFSRGVINGYGNQTTTVDYYAIDLLWKPVGRLIRFVLVAYPDRGKCVLMSTDLTLDPLTVISLYAMRFRIEVSFKQAVHTLGSFSYHFWLKSMERIKRGSGNQHPHRKSAQYRENILSKTEAYERFVAIGLVAQGLMQYLSTYFAAQVWTAFGGWLRTLPEHRHPSEQIVSWALRAALPEFLARSHKEHSLRKILTAHRLADRSTNFSKAA